MGVGNSVSDSCGIGVAMKIPAWLTIEATKRGLATAARMLTRIWTRKQAERIARERRERERPRVIDGGKDKDNA